MSRRRVAYFAIVGSTGAALVRLGAPSWAALAGGLAIAVGAGVSPPPIVKRLTTWSL